MSYRHGVPITRKYDDFSVLFFRRVVNVTGHEMQRVAILIVHAKWLDTQALEYLHPITYIKSQTNPPYTTTGSSTNAAR